MQLLGDQPGWVVPALDYELGYLLEPCSAPPGWQPGNRVLARFWRFRERITLLAADAEVWLAEQAGEEAAGIGGLCPAIDESRYRAAVERIKQFIYDGDCYQVNYTFPIDFSWFGSPLALYARLRQRQPVRYGGFVGNRLGGIVSLSPELFLERHGERLLTRPMKGTAARSEPSETLRNSVKDRAENLMIVDLLRNDIGRVSRPGSVTVPHLFAVESFPAVHHLVSTIHGELDARWQEVDLLRACFPGGSITGAPKIRAMEIIEELEPVRRNAYCGSIGYLSQHGRMDTSICIRTLIAEAGQLHCWAGGGIIADSDPDAEYQETYDKVARILPLLDAL